MHYFLIIRKLKYLLGKCLPPYSWNYKYELLKSVGIESDCCNANSSIATNLFPGNIIADWYLFTMLRNFELN